MDRMRELVADPDVDLVYIATPHSLHAEQAILCMKAGKNVLVEKSFTANAGQAREALAVAEETGMLCTEAIWTRYMPSRKLINEVIESGEIGEVESGERQPVLSGVRQGTYDRSGLCRWRAARCGRVSAELPGYGGRRRPWPYT